MIIPIGFEKREVTVAELRALQMRNLTATLTESDKWLLDALLSRLAISWANVSDQATASARRCLHDIVAKNPPRQSVPDLVHEYPELAFYFETDGTLIVT